MRVIRVFIPILIHFIPVPAIAQLSPISPIRARVVSEMSLFNSMGEIDMVNYLGLTEMQQTREEEYLSYLRANTSLSQEPELLVFHCYILTMKGAFINKDALYGYGFLNWLKIQYDSHGKASEDLLTVNNKGKLVATNLFLGPEVFRPIDEYLARLFYNDHIRFAFYVIEDGVIQWDRIICIKGNELFVIKASNSVIEQIPWDIYVDGAGSLFWPQPFDIPISRMAG